MRITTIIAAGLMAAVAVPAAAATIVIAPKLGTDPGAVQACAGAANSPTDRLCVNNGFIGNDFGSTAELQVAHSVTPGQPLRWPVFSVDNGFREIAHPGSATPTFITFTPIAGHEVRMISFDHRKRSATSTRPDYSLVDVATDTTLWSSQQRPPSGAFTTISINSGWFGNALRFGYNNGQGTIGLSNFTLEVRATPTTGAVPEPASWAMLIAGFGMVGMVSRRRHAAARRRIAA